MNESVRELLKSATAQNHQHIEKSMNLMDPALNLDTYIARLKKFYAFYLAYENKIDAAKILPSEINWELRKKSRLIASDLQSLGVHDLPKSSAQLPPLGSAASVLGSLYVTEGSTLGGQFISAHVKKVLSLDKGVSFFSGYGQNTSSMWKSFIAILESNIRTPEQRNEALKAAQETFACLSHGL